MESFISTVSKASQARYHEGLKTMVDVSIGSSAMLFLAQARLFKLQV